MRRFSSDIWLPTAVLVFIALVAAGIVWAVIDEANDPTSGYVTEKVYHAPWVSYTTNCIARNKDGICTGSITMPVHHVEQFCLMLKDGDNEGDQCVDSITWHKYAVGDHYPDPR